MYIYICIYRSRSVSMYIYICICYKFTYTDRLVCVLTHLHPLLPTRCAHKVTAFRFVSFSCDVFCTSSIV